MARIRNAAVAVVLLLAGALGANLIGGLVQSNAQSVGDEVIIVPAQNGAWHYTRSEGLMFCYVESNNYVRCLKR